MNSCIRVRVLLDTTPILFPKQCWLLFDSSACRVVGDIAHLISERFGINGTSGLQLYLDDFLLPMNEDAAIVRDNDRIQVKVVGYQRSTIPALTSVASPSVSTAVDGTEAHKEKHKKRKRESKDSGTERGGAPDEHGRCSLHSEANEGPSTEALLSGTKRKRKSQSSRGSSTSEAKEANGEKDVKDVSSAVPPPPPKKNKELRTSATKTTAGSLHVRFHSGSSESDTEEQPAVTAKKHKVAGGARKARAKEPEVDGPTEVTSKKSKVVTRFDMEGDSGTQIKEAAVSKEANDLPQKSKQKKSRRKKLTPDTIVGGSDDMFTTKTSIYTAPEVEPAAKETCPAPRAIPVQGALEQHSSGPVSEPAATTNGTALECISQPVKRNYEALPDLRGPPRVGDHIAFKLLELSVNCTPEVSSYKEGRVLSVSSDTVQIELSKESIQQHEEISEESALAKFSLPDSDQSEEDEEKPKKLPRVEPETVVELPLHALLQPKLL